MATSVATSTEAAPKQKDHRWAALAVIAVAQLMVVLDASIVTIALPDAQLDLHISDVDRAWVQTSYTLAFGGLLLLGGRIADYFGRKRVFLIGLIGFAAASALGGVAPNAGLLFSARALQGAMAALLAPAALSLITVTFTEPHERAKAFGVYGGISGGGAAIGLIAGGLLTDYLSWRWCLLVNIPIALITAFFGYELVSESRADGERKYDVVGAVLATLGLVSLVYGFAEAAKPDLGWSSGKVIGFIVAAVVLLAGFVAWEQRVASPLLPMRILTERNRGGSYSAFLLTGMALFPMFLLMTFYFQGTLGYSPLKAGFAFLPFSVTIIAGAATAAKLLPVVGPRRLAGTGLILAALGMIWFVTQLKVGGSFVTVVLPGELLIAAGMSQAFVTLSSTALIGVDHSDAGVASAVNNMVQQVGGSLGVALLNTIANNATTSYVKHHPNGLAKGLVHGYTSGLVLSVIFLLVGSTLVWGLISARREDLPDGGGMVAA